MVSVDYQEPIVRNARHTSRLELSQSAVKKNINFLKSLLKPSTQLSSVVKANAYGHGIPQMVKMLEKAGVYHFSVASAYEAEEVHAFCSPDSEIMIMGILYDEDIPLIIEHDIQFYVFNYRRLPLILEEARRRKKKARIHIEVETGINRTGMKWDSFESTLTFLKRNREHIEFMGLCTHLGGAESPSNRFRIDQQLERYHKALRLCKKRKFMPRYRHIACSAAILTMPDTHYDLVRAGVATYGFWPSRDTYYQCLQQNPRGKSGNPMRRVVTWKSDVMDIKEVPAGEFIGYGTAFQATRRMEIAVIPVGYGNGYPRGQSNRGYVLIHGKKAPIVGLINMNLFMVDVSHIPNIGLGDEVVLLGKQKNNTINVSSFTNATQLLNNEMMSRLPTAIPRYIVK